MRVSIVAILILAGCASNQPTVVDLKGVEKWGYPACAGTNVNLWTNCVGVRSVISENVYFSNTAVYRNGKQNGKRVVETLNTATSPPTKETCTSTLKNGQLDGWRECSNSVTGVNREFFVNGTRDLELERRAVDLAFQTECKDLGFAPQTPEFGNCILKLRELAQGSKPTTVIQSQPVQAAPTTADKIEGTKQILEAIQGVTTPAQSNEKQIDLGCVNVCQAQGKSLMYCRSDCAY